MTNPAASSLTRSGDPVKPIRLFRAGTFVSGEGEAVSLGAADFVSMAASYDRDANPAPLVIGHPQVDAPAYGWVERLGVDGGELVAWPDRDTLDQSFAEAVNAGRYAKVSAQFYAPGNPHNPTPGQYHLKHVGFLGAHAPGVKGLGRVSFAAGDTGEIATFEQETMMTATNPSVPGKADPAPAAAAAQAAQAASFAEREAAITAREAELAAREKAAADKAKADRHAANVSFAEGLIAQARLAPAGKDYLIAALDGLGGGDVVSFGEGVALAPDAALKKLFDQAVPLVSFGEAAPDDGKPHGGVASFAAPAGYDVDPASAAIFQKAKALQAETPGLDWMDAVRAAGG